MTRKMMCTCMMDRMDSMCCMCQGDMCCSVCCCMHTVRGRIDLQGWRIREG